MVGELEWVDEDDRYKRFNKTASSYTSIYRKVIRDTMKRKDFEYGKEYVLDGADGITFSVKNPNINT